MTRQLYTWGSGLGVALALVLLLALRKLRQKIIHAVEQASRVIKRSSGRGAGTRGGTAADSGSAGSKQGLIVSGTGAGGRLYSFDLEKSALEKAGVSFGRDEALVDFSIPDDLVSRRHLRFTWADGKVRAEDLNSTNGTFLNGRQLNAYNPVTVNVGDSIRIGRLTLSVSLLH